MLSGEQELVLVPRHPPTRQKHPQLHTMPLLPTKHKALCVNTQNCGKRGKLGQKKMTNHALEKSFPKFYILKIPVISRRLGSVTGVLDDVSTPGFFRPAHR